MDGPRTDPNFRIVSHFVLILRCLLLAMTLSTEATVVVIAGTVRRKFSQRIYGKRRNMQAEQLIAVAEGKGPY